MHMQVVGVRHVVRLSTQISGSSRTIIFLQSARVATTIHGEQDIVACRASVFPSFTGGQRRKTCEPRSVNGFGSAPYGWRLGFGSVLSLRWQVVGGISSASSERETCWAFLLVVFQEATSSMQLETCVGRLQARRPQSFTSLVASWAFTENVSETN